MAIPKMLKKLKVKKMGSLEDGKPEVSTRNAYWPECLKVEMPTTLKSTRLKSNECNAYNFLNSHRDYELS